MTIVSKTTAKSYFIQGAYPTQSNFADLIDSYQDVSDILTLVATGMAGKTGIIEIQSSAAVTANPVGAAGRLLIGAITAASARSAVSAQADLLNTLTANGDILYRVAGNIARLPVGVSGQLLASVSGLPIWQAPAATPAFTKSFTSTAQAITQAGALTLAHGLGTTPTLVRFSLRNVTAEGGFTTGQECEINPNQQDSSGTSPRGHACLLDATNINIRFGNVAGVYAIVRLDTGNTIVITNANWTLVARAWA